MNMNVRIKDKHTQKRLASTFATGNTEDQIVPKAKLSTKFGQAEQLAISCQLARLVGDVALLLLV